MQEHVQLTQKEINRDLLRGVFTHPLWWFAAAAVFTLVFITGVGAFGYMVNKGVGVTGLNRPVYWGVFMVNFVFWIGISHAGIMISAILRLTQAEWRRPVTRAAEVLTIFSLISANFAAALVHTGRPWRFYWVFPFDFSRGIWPELKPLFINYMFFYFEASVRQATILGIVGAGGIGLEFIIAIKHFKYPVAMTIVFAMLLLVVVTK